MRGTWGATKPGASIQIEEDFEPGCQECSGREGGCAYGRKTWTIVIAGRTKHPGPQVSPPQATRRLLGMTWSFDQQLTQDFQAFGRTGSYGPKEGCGDSSPTLNPGFDTGAEATTGLRRSDEDSKTKGQKHRGQVLEPGFATAKMVKPSQLAGDGARPLIRT